MLYSFRQWLVCLKHYVLMCSFMSAPDHLPNRQQYISISLVVYLLVGMLLVSEQRGVLVICAQILLEQVLLLGITWAGLNWKKTLPRLAQTYSALLGINLVFTIVTIAIYYLVDSSVSLGNEANKWLDTISFIIILWNLAVVSLIFKRALEVSTSFSVLISFNYFLLYQFLAFWFQQ
jgi:hypothetical protein